MHDLIYCFRMLRKRPSFTLVAVLTLALAIGASTALFSIVNVVVLNPFPYRDSSRLFFVRQSLPKIGVQDQFRSSGPEFVDVAKSGVFERVAAFEPVSRNLTGSDEPERIAAAKVSTDFFTMLGVEPLIGRTIAPNEQGPKGERVLVISHGLWQRRFGGDTAVLGQKVSLDDEPFTIIGVMPPQFRFDEGQAWFPFPFDFAEGQRAGRAFPILGRLKPGTTVEQVNAALANLARQNEQDFGSTNQEYAGRAIYVQPLAEFYFGPVRRALFILLGAVALILLIACANIANLLLAKSMSRAHEIAIRTAMGASRARIIRQMLIESAVLGLLGGVLGLFIASWGTRALVNLAPAGTIPTGLDITMNVQVLLFTLEVSLVTAFIFGLWPAIQGSRTQTRDALQAASQRATAGVAARRAQSVLVVAEVALSLILMVMAGLMIRSFAKLTKIDPGMNTANVMSMRINRSPAKSKDGSQNAIFFQNVIDRVKTLPGVEAAAVASHMPFLFTEDWPITVESVANAGPQTQSIDTRTVSADYFSTMQIPLAGGQFFTAEDGPQSPPVVLVNQTLVNRYWSNQDPLGKKIKIGNADAKSPWFTVKGVVKDSAQASLDRDIRPEIYFALGQMAGRYRRMNLAVRTRVEPKSTLAAIQSAIREVDRDQPVYQVQTIDELIGDSVGTRRFALMILILFAALALVLAVSGIYGVISYSVTQRTQEIGIRMALGAKGGDVLRLVLGQFMRLTVIGVALGLAAAYLLTRLMTSLLFGVTPTDITTFVLVSIGLSLVALVACLIPARRATRVDPLVALRYE
ncbi:MAG TPA: ABC transporter permease [Pyrinomonadaceae bacterium]|nr:ABC transporter permease [Pyrinomonadaceae bacterium]